MQPAHKERQTPEARFDHYVELLTETLGHADRAEPLRAYATGLMLPGARKSVEPMAARIDPRNVRRKHQSIHHFVADAPWSDERVLVRVREFALPALRAQGPIEAIPVKVGIFRNFGGFAEIEACK